MKHTFETKNKEVFEQLSDHAKLVLATSYRDKVTARTMSVLIKEGVFYFQTDHTFRKYQALKQNNRVALCIDNIQIEGVCEELGHPCKHPVFCDDFKRCFPASYAAYSALETERLFKVMPILIQRWNYIDNNPVIERLYPDQKKYEEVHYAHKFIWL